MGKGKRSNAEAKAQNVGGCPEENCGGAAREMGQGSGGEKIRRREPYDPVGFSYTHRQRHAVNRGRGGHLRRIPFFFIKKIAFSICRHVW